MCHTYHPNEHTTALAYALVALAERRDVARSLLAYAAKGSTLLSLPSNSNRSPVAPTLSIVVGGAGSCNLATGARQYVLTAPYYPL